MEDENVDLDKNSKNENMIPIQLDESSVSSQENNGPDSENVSLSDFDHNKLVANLII